MWFAGETARTRRLRETPRLKNHLQCRQEMTGKAIAPAMAGIRCVAA
jgi:hypothetical protein